MSGPRQWVWAACCAACCAGPSVNAQEDVARVREVATIASEVCAQPDRRRAYLNEGEAADGEIAIRFVGGEFEGRLPTEVWRWLLDILDPPEQADRADCIERVLPVLLRTLDQIARDEESAERNACIADTLAQEIRKPFSITARARCPGGGCVFRSGRCNRRSTTLRYEAPAGYSITEHEFIQRATHYGTTGGMRLRGDDAGRVSAVEVRLSCDPPNYPGAPGGWNQGELTGTMSYIDLGEARQRATEMCTTGTGG
ncbi:MAG: hypothetical protein OXU81_03235 [Gammaproteobacteria bacterium]|nr:hypothetical protein [Gammaproteobacteria bacterium]